ncbi:mechanosensitive ion channel domain-containing protein [Rhizosaccharibacter radicis]|uniref:Mechanosensitive ion channel n=1 Tax=Rhizosaccharibacter radicis TaxID=2782605 RepID=A0ABT1VUG7_9PROT|nr:mechanosensitive ion channel [Acetobacteraceae bacterium KSS12]
MSAAPASRSVPVAGSPFATGPRPGFRGLPAVASTLLALLLAAAIPGGSAVAQDAVRDAASQAAHDEQVPDQTAAEADGDSHALDADQEDRKGATHAAPRQDADSQAILRLLNDPRRRAALAAALAGDDVTPTPHRAATAAPAPAPKAAAPAAKPAPTPATPSKGVTVEQDSLIGSLGTELRQVGGFAADRTRSFGRLFVDMALAGRWLERELAAPASRVVFVDVAWRAVAMILIAMAVDRLVLLALRRPLRALSRQSRAVEEDAQIAGTESADVGAPAGMPPAPPAAGPGTSPETTTVASAAALGSARAQDGAPTIAGTGSAAVEPVPGSAPARGEPDVVPGSALDLPVVEPAVPGAVQAGPVHPDEQIYPASAPATPVLPQAPLPSADDAMSPERAARNAEARQRDAMHHRRTLRVLRRLPFALLRFILRLMPLLVFLLVGNLGAPLIADSARSELVITTLTNLYGIGRVAYLLMEMLLAPDAPGVRLTSVSDARATFLMRWWAMLVAVPIVGLCIQEVGHVLSMPSRASDAVIRAVVLVEHVLLAVLIWQTRQAVAVALHPPRRLRDRPLGRLLVLLATYWWLAALFFDIALWVVWAARIRDGYSRMWSLFLSSCAVLLICRLIGIALLGILDRVFRLTPDTALRHPALERRFSHYYPVMRRLVSSALFVVAALALLQAWNVPVITWLTRTPFGARLMGALGSVATILVVGVAVWELVNSGLERQIGRFDDAGQVARAVRLRTLLPILRTILFVVLAVIITLTVLQSVGVNIAPLLAGAGIVGVAVGFGSQKLVQDFITGIFLLVENAMQVGDTVTVGGVTGTVEHLSIRTIRLRGGDGSLQIIPFSSVSTVANMSRDFAVASVSVSIAFSEDTDRVCDMMRGIGAELRSDPAFADLILADFGLNGVDSLGEYAVAISGTIRCTVGGRWPVQREFNRRLRQRMDEGGIAMPAARQTINVPKLPLPVPPPSNAPASP